MPLWLLAEAGSVFQERANPETGAPEVILFEEDDYGARKPVGVGKTLKERTAGLDLSRAELLRKHVDAYVAGLVHVDARKAVHRKLSDIQNEALAAAGSNQNNAMFQEIEAAVRTSRELIERGRS
jgi:hypothetical protein